MTATVVVAVLAFVFWLTEQLDLLPRSRTKQIVSAVCAVSLMVAAYGFRREFTEALRRYAAHKTNELVDQIKHVAPSLIPDDQDTSTTTEPSGP